LTQAWTICAWIQSVDDFYVRCGGDHCKPVSKSHDENLRSKVSGWTVTPLFLWLL
jgi:hypothetical protein